MTYFFSAYSSHFITPRELASVMNILKAEFDVDIESWIVKNGDVEVEVRLANQDVDDLEEAASHAASTELHGSVASRVAVGYRPGPPVQKGMQLVRAVCLALADSWPVVLDDNAGTVERIQPRSVRYKR